jgi:hypothetical protein
MPQTYAFVTIGHAADFGLLELQARSMALYCPPALVHEILIVENFDAQTAIYWRPALLKAYGPLAHLVWFVDQATLAPMEARHGGWWRQQVLKLAVARVVTAERYLVLDCKNHLFRPLEASFLETPAGQPKLNGYGFEKHSLRDALIRTLGYFAIDAAPFISHFTRTSTPFLMLTAVALEVVAYVEQREKRPFAEAFLDLRLTEFFLYSAYLQSKGRLQSTYSMTQPFCAQIWEFSAIEAGVREALGRAAEIKGGPFIAVHPRALKAMGEPARRLVAEFWHAAGLFPSVADAATAQLSTRSRV